MTSLLSTITSAIVAAATVLPPNAEASTPSTLTHFGNDGGRTAGVLDEDDARARVLVGAPAGQLGLQRGDFVPPDLLLIVYEEAWLETVEAMVREATPTTNVHVMVNPREVNHRRLVEWSRSLGAHLMGMKFDTPWIRDYGPLQRMDGPERVTWLDFDYGPDRMLDDDVPTGLVNRFSVPFERSVFSFDGGAVVSNGAGLCAITERSLDEAGVTADDDDAVESLLETLGCEVVAAMPDLPNEPTGHADMMVQFVARDRAMAIELDPTDHPDEAFLVDAAVQTLKMAATMAGMKLKITRVPAAYDDRDGSLFSYVNGTRLRDRYLAPSFSGVDPSLEQRARMALRDAMPGIAIASIPADDVLASAGVLHCITLGLSLPRHR